MRMRMERIKKVEPIYKSKDSTSKQKEESKSFREHMKEAIKKRDRLGISTERQAYNRENSKENGGR